MTLGDALDSPRATRSWPVRAVLAFGSVASLTMATDMAPVAYAVDGRAGPGRTRRSSRLLLLLHNADHCEAG